jgi:hypothetical protein
MVKRTQCLVLSLALGLASAAVRADVIVNSSLSLTHLQITPSTGTLSILPGVNVSTFAQALDSFGGLDQEIQQYNRCGNVDFRGDHAWQRERVGIPI